MPTKNTVCFVIATLCGTVGVVQIHASDALKAVVASYLEIHAQLAADKINGASAPARAIAAKAAEMGKAGEPIAKAAKALADAPDVNAARDAFGALSDAVIAAGNAEGWKDVGEVKLAYCPMVKRSWLQKNEPQIKNPYYGSQMLTCGEFKPIAK
jgi:hypothetical protein